MQQELTIRSQDGGIQNQRALNKKKDRSEFIRKNKFREY